MANHITLTYSTTPKPESMDGSLLLELDTGKIFVRVNGDWQQFRYFQTRFVELWQELPTPPAGKWVVTDLSPWVPHDAVAVQLVTQTLRTGAGPERHVTFGARAHGTLLERKGVGVVRTGGMIPFRANFVTMLAHLHVDRTIDLFVDSDGADATAVFTLSGYFISGQ